MTSFFVHQEAIVYLYFKCVMGMRSVMTILMNVDVVS